MTLIVGLNLSDRVYLAADSRVTLTGQSAVKYIDNVIKIAPLYGASVMDSVPFDTNLMSVAVAGDLHLANFFYSEIKKDIYANLLSTNIRKISLDLDRNYFLGLAEKWLSSGGEYDKCCCLIFGGIIDGSPKIVRLDVIEGLRKLYLKHSEESRKNIPKLEELIITDPIFAQLNEKMKQQKGEGVIQNLETSFVPEIPSHLEKATLEDRGTLEEYSDSYVFAIEIGIKKDGLCYVQKRAEYGEFIARGAGGIDEGQLPDELLSVLEFMPGRNNNTPHLFEAAILETTIFDIAQKRNLETIGGTVFINAMRRKTSEIITKNSSVVAGRMHIQMQLGGAKIPVALFTQVARALAKNTDAQLSIQ